MRDLCDSTIHSEPGSVTTKGKSAANGNEIHPLHLDSHPANSFTARINAALAIFSIDTCSRSPYPFK